MCQKKIWHIWSYIRATIVVQKLTHMGRIPSRSPTNKFDAYALRLLLAINWHICAAATPCYKLTHMELYARDYCRIEIDIWDAYRRAPRRINSTHMGHIPPRSPTNKFDAYALRLLLAINWHIWAPAQAPDKVPAWTPFSILVYSKREFPLLSGRDNCRTEIDAYGAVYAAPLLIKLTHMGADESPKKRRGKPKFKKLLNYDYD